MKTGQGVGNNKADLGAGNKSGQCTDQEQVSEQDQERSQPNRNSLAVNSTMSELGIGSGRQACKTGRVNNIKTNNKQPETKTVIILPQTENSMFAKMLRAEKTLVEGDTLRNKQC